jgi:hypothetical protein
MTRFNRHILAKVVNLSDQDRFIVLTQIASISSILLRMLAYDQMFHVEHYWPFIDPPTVTPEQSECSTWNISPSSTPP